jgi:hypothetical protein
MLKYLLFIKVSQKIKDLGNRKKFVSIKYIKLIYFIKHIVEN